MILKPTQVLLTFETETQADFVKTETNTLYCKTHGQFKAGGLP